MKWYKYIIGPTGEGKSGTDLKKVLEYFLGEE